MAGPQDIQRNPYGLLNTLGMASGGEVPRLLATQVLPCVELTQFYGGNRVIEFNDFAALAAGGEVLLTVPSAQYWIFFFAVATVFGAAAITNLQFSLDYRDKVGRSLALGTFRQLTPGLVATDEINVPYTAPYPFVMSPGESLRLKLATLVGVANAAGSLRALVGRLG